MVDLSNTFWNQVYKQFSIWHEAFSTSVISRQLVTTSFV